MSDQEFNALIDRLIGGLPVTLVMTRLALLVRALVESGGPPAADLLRALVTLRAGDDEAGDGLAADVGLVGEDAL